MIVYLYFKENFNSDKLIRELKTQTFGVLFSHVDTLETGVSVFFTEELSSENLIILADLVTNQQPDSIVKLTSFTASKYNPTEPPFEVDFVVGLKVKLHRKATIIKGECIAEEFFESYVGGVYSNLIVKEETTFSRDLLGFPLFKEVTIKYALENGGFHSKVKTWKKYYSGLEQIQEGKTRRGNLVANIQKPCMGLISLAMIGTTNATPEVILEGRRFLAEYKNEFEVFISDSNKDIIKCLNEPTFSKYISNANFTWVDYLTPYGFTIRQFLIGELTI